MINISTPELKVFRKKSSNMPLEYSVFSINQLIHPKIYQEMVETFISFTPTKKAILELLIFLSEHFKRVTISQATIASKLGKERETINRLLGEIPSFMLRRKLIKDHKLTRYETKRCWKYFNKDRYTEYTIDPVWKMVYERSDLRAVFQKLEGVKDFLKTIASISKKSFLKLWNGTAFSQKCHTILDRLFTRYRTNKGKDKVGNKKRLSLPSHDLVMSGDDIFLLIKQKLENKR